MDKMGAEKSMCVGFEADNTGSQDALARALNLQRLKCGPHAANLAALGLKRLKLFKPLVKDMSKLIHFVSRGREPPFAQCATASAAAC